MTKRQAPTELEERIGRLVSAEFGMFDDSKTTRLERLSMLALVQSVVERTISDEVALMRSPGARPTQWNPQTYAVTSDRYTWEELGQALKMPKSSAQRKYAAVAPRERTR